MTAASKPFDFSFRDALLRDLENAALYPAEYLEEGIIGGGQGPACECSPVPPID